MCDTVNMAGVCDVADDIRFTEPQQKEKEPQERGQEEPKQIKQSRCEDYLPVLPDKWATPPVPPAAPAKQVKIASRVFLV